MKILLFLINVFDTENSIDLVNSFEYVKETRDEILKSLQIHGKDTQVTTILQQLRELIEQEKTEKVSVMNKIWSNENLIFSPSTFSPNEQIFFFCINDV